MGYGGESSGEYWIVVDKHMDTISNKHHKWRHSDNNGRIARNKYNKEGIGALPY